MVLRLSRPPLNESSAAVFSEKAFLSGTILSAIFYGTKGVYFSGSSVKHFEGIHLIIFLQCTRQLYTILLLAIVLYSRHIRSGYKLYYIPVDFNPIHVHRLSEYSWWSNCVCGHTFLNT